MAIAAGTRFNHYEILAPLGAGGMGEVYRARDERLGRDVAIKVLPASFAQDPDRLRRFEQEAKATSALNHPNILTVHDIGTHDGQPFIVAELLEGEELRAQLEDGALQFLVGEFVNSGHIVWHSSPLANPAPLGFLLHFRERDRIGNAEFQIQIKLLIVQVFHPLPILFRQHSRLVCLWRVPSHHRIPILTDRPRKSACAPWFRSPYLLAAVAFGCCARTGACCGISRLGDGCE